MNESGNEIVIPVISEELHVGTVTVPTGGVRFIIRVVQHEQVIQQELAADRVSIQHVAINRVVDGPDQPIHQLDGVLIVPVVEEVLKIERQWILKEELHITRVRETVNHEETVTLNREEVEVERMQAPGDGLGQHKE